MQKLPFWIGECVQCTHVCMHGREFLMQGFVSHSLEVVNNVVLKKSEVLPSDMIQSHCTCIKLCPTLPYWWGVFGHLTSLDIFTSHS